MTTQKFDATPTPNEAMNLDDISAEKVKEASMQSSHEEPDTSEKV